MALVESKTGSLVRWHSVTYTPGSLGRVPLPGMTSTVFRLAHGPCLRPASNIQPQNILFSSPGKQGTMGSGPGHPQQSSEKLSARLSFLDLILASPRRQERIGSVKSLVLVGVLNQPTPNPREQISSNNNSSSSPRSINTANIKYQKPWPPCRQLSELWVRFPRFSA